MILRSGKIKNAVIVLFVSALFLCGIIFRKPLINPRYLECYNPSLNLDSLELFSLSGCYYSWYAFAFFNLFTRVSPDHYRFALILVFVSFFALNMLVTFKIAKLRKIKFTYLLLLAFLSFDFGVWSSLDGFLIFFLFNLSLLFYLLNTKVCFFLSGFFGSLTSVFRPHAVIFIFVLALVDTFYIKFSKRSGSLSFGLTKGKLSNLLLFLAGLSLIPFTYLFNSSNYLRVIFSSSSRSISLTNLNHAFLLYLIVFVLVLFNKKKSSLHKTFLLTTPFFFYISLLNGMGSRFMDFLALLAPLLLLENFKKNKSLILALIILLIPYNWFFVFQSASIYESKNLFENQFLLLNQSRVLTDLAYQEVINLNHDVYPLLDYWLFDYLLDKGLVSKNKLFDDLTSAAEEVDLLIIGPPQYESYLNFVLEDFNSSKKIIVPTLDHDCLTCRHVATIYFKDGGGYDAFKQRLADYWMINHARLCLLNRGYYYLMRYLLSDLITLPLCNNNQINTFFIADYLTKSYGLFLLVAFAVLLILLILGVLLNFKKFKLPFTNS